MPPKRYSIYASPALAAALDSRLPQGSAEDGGGFRTRSSLLSAIADRYSEIVRREVPRLTLAEWLLIFDALNGCWLLDNAALAANGVALEVADAARLNGAGEKWGVDGEALAARIHGLSFAAKVAVVDAAERFWTLDVQPDSAQPSDADPFAHWRAPVRALVGASAINGGSHE